MFHPINRILFTYLLISYIICTASTGLSPSEVKGLRDVAKALRKSDWDFSIDPCSGNNGWSTENVPKIFQNSVTCDCSFSNGTLCHVTSIILMAQSLSGNLPKELVELPYLQEIVLSRNYLNGTIPLEWGSMKLVNITLMGNRLTGSIPRELANITTLQCLALEFNYFTGDLPPELGLLPNLKILQLTSNNFTGQIPETFARLTTLKDFRIADNQFFGTIPNFIKNWTNITKLMIQASGLSGPIPPGIAFMENLEELRISDLSAGLESNFPQLKNIPNLKSLILRNCNMKGSIPNYVGEMMKLKYLDLSFNKLSGQVPTDISNIQSLEYIYLTANKFSEPVPEKWFHAGMNIDLSYNNFSTIENSTENSCQEGNVNLFGSFLLGNHSNVSCLRNFQCPKTWYSVHINCGGRELKVNGTVYEEDTISPAPSTFYQSKTNWALSSTGSFIDDSHETDAYTWKATSLKNNSEILYTSARLSPLSLTYYAFCMGNGNYTVKLHFAEGMFTDDQTYKSLGRRLFDVYIQEKLVLKDFNIVVAAGGVGKSVTKSFIVSVSSTTLEIRFYWAGKGTVAIPTRGVYGPLISAISVNPEFIPPSTSEKTGSTGRSVSPIAIVGAVLVVLVVLVVIAIIVWWKCFLRNNTRFKRRDISRLDLKTGKFTLRQITAATNNFDEANKIGEGGFGSVYKGLLPDGSIIAVKQLSSKSKQGTREFLNEIGMISALQHPHLVELYGCCVEGDQLLLVYEYLENNNVGRAIFGPEESRLKLDWPTRYRICLGIAKGLAFLHAESRFKIVHRDIKATNVLLDKDLTPKISDFGLAKLNEEEKTHISTRVAGTYGYMAPEYAMRGHLTNKADVYSYGVVVLEIISGRSNNIPQQGTEDYFYLLDWAVMLEEKGDLMELVDSRLGSDYDKKEVALAINVALRCTSASLAARPTMSSVVSILEGRTSIEDELMPLDEILYKHHQLIHDNMSANSNTHSMSVNEITSWVGSSSSLHHSSLSPSS